MKISPILLVVIVAVVAAAIAILLWRSASLPFVPALLPGAETPPSQPASETPGVPPGPILLATPYSSETKGEPLQFIWVIDDSQGREASHTALHWGIASHAGEYGSDVAPQEAGYSNLTEEYASGTFALPGNFTATLTFPDAGTYYLRAHAIIGGKNYWSPEYMLEVR